MPKKREYGNLPLFINFSLIETKTLFEKLQIRNHQQKQTEAALTTALTGLRCSMPLPPPHFAIFFFFYFRRAPTV